MRKSLYTGAILASVLCAGIAAAAKPAAESTTVASAAERAAVIDSIVHRFQGHKEWSSRYAQKLRGLSATRLEMAKRAGRLEELETVFVEAPFASGTEMTSIINDQPGNVTLMAAASVPKASPAANPPNFADLVFTAVAPCRIYDSRFSTAPLGGVPGGSWPANTNRTIGVGPYADYSFQGGQAIACMGNLAGIGEVAAIMGSVSTVSQSGPGFITLFSAGAANPSPYGVVQYYQPGYVQTSFVVMTTDLATELKTTGFSGQASTHVIVDVVGYFARPKAAALDCIGTTPASVAIAAGANTTAFAAACPAGYTEVAIQCGSDSYLTWLAAGNDSQHCAYHNSDSLPHNINATAKCCRSAGR